MKKRLLLMTSVLALSIASISGCGSSSSSVAKIPEIVAEDTATVAEKSYKYDLTLDNKSDNKYALVASNDSYEMYIDKKAFSICVKQKSTGKIFDTALVPEVMGMNSEEILPNTVKKYQSPFQVTYFDKTMDSAATVTAYISEFDLAQSGIKTYEIKEDNKVVGVRAEYPIDANGNNKDIAITVTVDYYLTEKGFDVALPVDAVKEEGNYAVTKITVLPNFASATNNNNGFFMYPDGSGAIMEFKDTSHDGEAAVNYSVYGELQNYKHMLNEWDEEDSQVFMPIYGANVENNSYLAIISEGEETATISVVPQASAKDPFNHMYASFEYRKSFEDQRYAVAGSDKTVLTFDKELLNISRRISYNLFESGEETSYDDMAVCYRDYLIASGVQKDESSSDGIPVSLDFFMGINEEGMIFDTFQTVSTFEDVEKMIDTLKEAGVENIEAQLKGWTKDGYYTDPVQFPVNSKLGGSKGLKALTDKYADNDNIKISLETNLIEARAESDEYNMNTDTITLGNYLVFSDHDETLYLLSPNVSYGKLKNMIANEEKNNSTGIAGYSFYGIGQYLFYNYNANNTLTATQCKQIWQDMLKDTDEKYGTAIAQGGNQYVLYGADKITAIPFEDSGYRITTKSVPVYQIALHGLVEFTGEPGNLSSNLTEEKLKWVEYGYMPYFELTYTGSEQLKYTDYNQLFSSEFDTWQDEVVEIYKDFNANLKDVWNSYIVSHEEVATDVFKVTYENGKTIYVNYTEKEYKTDGGVVEAESYLVIDK